jgi:predicted ATP-dependent protease
MTSNNNNEFQPPSLSDYVSLRAESAVEASVKRAMEPFMSELRTFKVEMKAEMKEFKAEVKEDLRVLKNDVAELKSIAELERSAWKDVLRYAGWASVIFYVFFFKKDS